MSMTALQEAPVSSAPGSAQCEAEFLDRIRAFAPRLAETAGSTSQGSRLNEEMLKELKALGMFRAHVPAEYGGLQLPYAVLASVAMELGRACAPTAWVIGVTSSGSWRVAKCKPSTQKVIWGQGPDALIAGAFVSKGAVCEPVEGGFVVSGEWMFCSGVHHADWLGLVMNTPGADGKPLQQFGFLPRSQVTTIPNWRSVGMSATGSDSVILDKIFISDDMLTPYADISEAVAPGQAGHDVSAYRIGLTSVFSYSVAAPVIGAAQGALEAYILAAPKRTSAGGEKLPVSQATQMRISESGAEIEAARALCERDMALARNAAETSRELSEEEKLRLMRNAAFIAMACRRATTRLVEAMGARGQDPSNPVQRFHADVCAGAAHGILAWETIGPLHAGHLLAKL